MISPWGKNSNSETLTIPLVVFISSFVFSQLNSGVNQDVSSVALGFVLFQPLSVMERTTVGTILMNWTVVGACMHCRLQKQAKLVQMSCFTLCQQTAFFFIYLISLDISQLLIFFYFNPCYFYFLSIYRHTRVSVRAVQVHKEPEVHPNQPEVQWPGWLWWWRRWKRLS